MGSGEGRNSSSALACSANGCRSDGLQTLHSWRGAGGADRKGTRAVDRTESSSASECPTASSHACSWPDCAEGWILVCALRLGASADRALQAHQRWGNVTRSRLPHIIGRFNRSLR